MGDVALNHSNTSRVTGQYFGQPSGAWYICHLNHTAATPTYSGVL